VALHSACAIVPASPVVYDERHSTVRRLSPWSGSLSALEMLASGIADALEEAKAALAARYEQIKQDGRLCRIDFKPCCACSTQCPATPETRPDIRH
jgi:hypothetical protein